MVNNTSKTLCNLHVCKHLCASLLNLKINVMIPNQIKKKFKRLSLLNGLEMKKSLMS